MKILKWIYKSFLILLVIGISYFLIALLLTSITIERKHKNKVLDKSIFLSSNGVHLDLIIPKKHIKPDLLESIVKTENSKYLAFGWGDENFYINTPTWGDLTFSNAFKALFMKSPSLMHVTRFNNIQKKWVEIKINTNELSKLNTYLLSNFKLNKEGGKMLLKNKGYTLTDDFYKAKGSYSCFKTCNTWVNTGFKYAGLKSCYWTPFDFGLMKKYNP